MALGLRDRLAILVVAAAACSHVHTIKDRSRPATIAPTRTTHVDGVVLDPDGSPCSAARVLLVRQGDDADGRGQIVPVGRDGRFSVDGLRAGGYVLTATGRGYAAIVPRVVVSEDSPVTGVELHLGLGAVVIRGRVASLGKPLRSASVAVNQDGFWIAQSDSSGGFEIVVPSAAKSLVATAPGFVRAEKEFDPDVPPDFIEFVLTPSTPIVGRVIRRDNGQPVPSAELDLRSIHAEEWDRAPLQHRHSSLDGTFRFDVPPGEYTIRAESGSLVGHSAQRIEVIPGTSVASIVITLEALPTVSGHVFNARTGQPIPKARVYLVDGTREHSVPRFDAIDTERTDNDGQFVFKGVEPGHWALATEAEHCVERRAPLVVERADITNVRILMPEAALIRGTVLTLDGRPVARVRVAGSVLPGRGERAVWAYASTRADGSFSIDGLPPGEATVAVQSNSGESKPRTIAIASDRENPIDLRVDDSGPRTATIEGTVRWDDGVAAAGVTVKAAGALFTLHDDSTHTEGDGSYRLTVKARGKDAVASISIVLSDTENDSLFERDEGHRVVRVSPGTTAHADFSIRRRTHQIVGRVLGPDGAPLVGARVIPSSELHSAGWQVFGLANRRSVETGSDGSFVLDRLPGGKLVLFATYGALPVLEERQVETDTDVTLKMSMGAAVSGRVIDPHGQSVSDCELRVTHGWKTLGHQAGKGDHHRLSETGTFEIQHLPVQDLGYPNTTFDFDVLCVDGRVGTNDHVAIRDGEWRRELEIKLGAGGSVAGRVVDDDGKPLRDVTITDYEQTHKKTRTDADGRFELAGLMPGRSIQVSVELGGYLPDYRKVEEIKLAGVAPLGTIRLMKGSLGAGGLVLGSTRLDSHGLVDGVGAQSWEQEGGLRVGDRVISVDGHLARGYGEFALNRLLGGPDGTNASVVIVRKGVRRELSLKRKKRDWFESPATRR